MYHLSLQPANHNPQSEQFWKLNATLQKMDREQQQRNNNKTMTDE